MNKLGMILCHLRLTLLLVLTCLTSSLPARAQDGSPKFISEGLSKDTVFWAWRGNSGVQQCGYCHYQAGNDFASRQSELSRFSELRVWLEKDKHAIARQRIEPIPLDQQAAALQRFQAKITADGQHQVTVPEFWLGPSNALSAKICQQLNQDVSTEAGYAWFRENCLTCHGGYRFNNSKVSGSTSGNFSNTGGHTDKGQPGRATEFEINDLNHPGISCIYCHQEAAGSSQWVDLHSGLTTQPRWRSLSPAQKSAVGMRDLTPARQQAELCFECHIGNMDKGMFVTHEMYAAGHPPLPAVELRTLVERMPRHWQTPHDLLVKSTGNKNENPIDNASVGAYFRSNFGVSGDSNQLNAIPWEAHTIATGALVAEQQWLRLLIQANTKNRWGDYALYDCSACHHNLQLDSPRQARRISGSPGRPRLAEWPHPGAFAVAASIGDDQFPALFQELDAAIKKRAFGDRKLAIKASENLLAHIDDSLKQLSLSRLPVQYNTGLLAELCETSPESLLDYQAARWINWSARGLVTAKGSNDKLKTVVDELGRDSDKKTVVTDKLPATSSEIIYPDFVESELQQQQTYDPDAFAEQLKKIRQHIRSISAPNP